MKEKEYTSKENSERLNYLKPKDTLNIVGRMSYKESHQAWNIIQLRKEIVTLFPQLKEKTGEFGYEMFYNSSIKEIKRILDEMDEKKLVPILLLLERVKE